MPLGDFSRHLFCQGLTDGSGNNYLSDRVPYRFVSRPDNRTHTVVEGDTLFSLADQYFAPMENPWQFFWVIADFQPDPIIDASLVLAKGSTLIIPSVRLIVEEIFNESRRPEFGA